MKWTSEAEKAISRVPFFVRRRVRKKVEEEAVRQGAAAVDMCHVIACRSRYMQDMSGHIKGFQVETCFGSSGCPNRLTESNDLVEKLESLLQRQGLLALLREKVKGDLKLHHEFRVTVADCPNACSRPQISDLGIIGVRMPFVSDTPCSRCMSCVEVCAEHAVNLAEDSEGPWIDLSKCVMCGQCVGACPTGTLGSSVEGYRLSVGGKLGRHPQLARQLDGVYKEAEVLQLVEKCLLHYKTHNEKGERFGEILNRTGLAFMSHSEQLCRDSSET